MAQEKEFLYVPRLENLCNYGVCYTTYGISVKISGYTVPVQHDVTMKLEEAERICKLLNSYRLEPEQAKYVIEDCIIESYLV